jgi:S-DNA-T family DNA segregation ATPase FtsK/SpoIIIE
MAARSRAQTQTNHTGRTREIAGICLLGLGTFSALSLVSMHAGSEGMMGPGGRAMARGLYSLAGISAYFLVTVLLVVAVRVFRGRSVVRSLGELVGCAGLLAGSTMLSHLPFAGELVTLEGPGGVLGQWLSHLFAGVVGIVGTVMAAGIILTVSVLVLTNISVSEVTDVVINVVARALVAVGNVARAGGRIAVAAFPKRNDRELLEARNPFDEDEQDDDERDDDEDAYEDDGRSRQLAIAEVEDTIADEIPIGRNFDRTIRGMPAAPVPSRQAAIDSDAVRVGRARAAVMSPRLVAQHDDGEDEDFSGIDEEFLRDGGMDDEIVMPVRSLRETRTERPEPRRALSAVVAEVAEVECAALAAAEEREDLAAIVDTRAPAMGRPVPALNAAVVSAGLSAGAPVIVKPANQASGRALPTVAVPATPPIIVDEAAAARSKEALEKARKEKEDGPGFIRLSDGEFRLPTADLLEYVPPPSQEIDKKGLYDMAARLEQAMSNYGVKGTVSAINMGPVVTMYEFAPAPGTRTGKIAQLENDLAMALEAQAVRIVAPIPGKAVVGVEVPNKSRQTVYLKEILSDETFRGAASKLQIALGKDIQGNPVTVNLAKMPHLLVAGTTGSGKSVTVNGMITSLLYNATPEEVRFIMVDPKMLELSIYEGIPHLLLPVVTDPKKANLALRWAVDEMERRYELLSKSGVRDIGSYNAKIELESKRKDSAAAALAEAGVKAAKKLKVVIEGPGGEEELASEEADDANGVIAEELREEISNAAAAAQSAAEKPAETPRKLPYIVIVIDEFADLMMVAPKDVETSVARLAQKARAAGLHVILATQRPSVDVITGLIKANFPSRIALQVAGKMDSRVIIDQTGAESLLGNGDMLFSDRGTKLRRIHGAFLSDDEVHRVVTCLKAQAKPVYDMDILKPREDEDAEGAPPAEKFEDPLYDQAIAIVCETRQASVSFIQRRLQIGYNRSARMVEQMERDGIVGPANGIKPREVLAPGGDYLTHAV